MEREREIEAAFADFLHHSDVAAEVREQAQERAQRVLTNAEDRAGAHESLAQEAIRMMAKLGEPVAGIAELIGWTRTQVREVISFAQGAP